MLQDPTYALPWTDSSSVMVCTNSVRNTSCLFGVPAHAWAPFSHINCNILILEPIVVWMFYRCWTDRLSLNKVWECVVWHTASLRVLQELQDISFPCNWFEGVDILTLLSQILTSNVLVNNNNNYYCLLHLGCHPVAVVILHVNKTWNWLLLNLSREGYMRSI